MSETPIATATEVTSRPADDIRESAWHITINSNRRDTELNRQRMRDCMKEVFSDDRMKDIIKFKFRTKSGPSKFPNHSYKRPYIQEVVSEYSLEVGKKQHRLHSHALVTVRHRSQIQLDYKKVRDFASACIGTTVHMHGQLVPTSQVFKNYIVKDQPRRK